MKNTFKLMLLVTALFTSNSFSQCVKKIVANTKSQIILKEDNTLWAKGNNWWGQLGLPINLGTNINVMSFTQIGTSNQWKDVIIGSNHTLALKYDGTIWSWGRNTKGGLGNGTYTDNHIPTQVGTDSDWKEIAVGEFFSIAIKNNGEIWGWGENEEYQLGLGDFYNRTLPVQIGLYTSDWKTVSVSTNSNHVVALKNNGTMWGWGQNIYGELGLGDLDNRNNPTLMSSATDWKEIVGGWGFTLALKNNGTLWSTGYQQDYVSGSTDTTHFFQIGTSNEWNTIGTKFLNHSGFAIKNNGTLWGWGNNSYYQLGLGTGDVLTPTQIGTGTNWTKISPATNKTFFQDSTSNLFTSGYNFETNSYYSTLTSLDPCPTLNTNDFQNTENTNTFVVYPNPSSDFITIKLEIEEQVQQLALFNSLGQLIKTYNKNETYLNISDLASGYYLLEVTTEKSKYVHKILKKTY